MRSDSIITLVLGWSNSLQYIINMLKKFATLAIVATVSIAMPQDISEIPVTADFPMPVIP